MALGLLFSIMVPELWCSQEDGGSRSLVCPTDVANGPHNKPGTKGGASPASCAVGPLVIPPFDLFDVGKVVFAPCVGASRQRRLLTLTCSLRPFVSWLARQARTASQPPEVDCHKSCNVLT
ncbi:hypothetical protein B0T17DRAFT_540861 [Bombardia bombarda]|uniref:Secreted protein n=1 Tax=Bombardia bombarda TaxID=252184 RepID=A0AA40BVD9_9PEZI|nr:hypothetical protein B0T17DRAFT_540861 [Bombardia bombarda]